MTTNISRATQTRAGLFIDGTTIETGNWSPVHDPSDPSTAVGYSADASLHESRAAVAAADAAFPGWAATPILDRVSLILDALSGIEGYENQLSELLVRENGKTLQEASIDVTVFELRFRAACELAATVAEPVRLAGPPFRTEVHRLPVGVVSIIVPFNWPLAILAASLPYALVAGNTVVVKAPPTTPLAVMRALEILGSRLPKGVINVISGANSDVEPLITDSRVQHVVFTGSTAAGTRIMTLAAQSLTKVTLELGGNDPAIILDDAELSDSMLSELVAACFLTSGQVCMSVKRIYVARSRFAELADGMGRILENYIVGNGFDPAVNMGPLNSAAQRDHVIQLLDQARRTGTEVREFGRMTEQALAGAGHYLLPSLVLDPPAHLDIVTLEQFGPTVPIMPFDDLDELIGQLNNEWSGLCSSVWTSNEELGGDIARRMRTGTTWVNQANAGACDDRAPFGGFRQSGIGREMGTDGILDFTEPHTVTFRA
ncbi:aldehyde dehydrogenase family protein [Pseudarthrobacter siccitolerans]|uniref:Aldehyde dehydrogenase family protein n=1 Tax=Pseudarthrobacter siccitolerans TaxID=861266 RepID=A0A024H2L0_9MICC|nr:aldehyde dehydrogenase family protein [Pseudarthrobacter siccitolerans]CCQ46122.1 aldehyde dehydrogenase family protein [Pseudarthrobacter siccitolerans]